MPVLPEFQLKVQINQIDHSLEPSGPLDNSPLPLSPVIRIYGPSSDGRKACVHVHQVYPYFYVEYNGSLEPRQVRKYISRLKHSLNHAIALSFKRDPESSKAQFIRAIVLVKGVHFYGFHSNYSPFLKILVVDPSCLSRVVTLMQSGTVMSERFRTYENHLSFILQFLCDFGLYGCGWIELGRVLERGREAEKESSTPQFTLSPHFRQSRMALEVDSIAYHILNRRALVARNLHHKLEVPAPPLPDEPFVPSVRELWEDERQRRAARGLNPSPEIPIVLSDVSRESSGEWMAEARWWDEIRKRIEQEAGSLDLSDESNANSRRWEDYVMTTFESIEALWETEWRMWKPARKNDNEKSGFDGAEKGVGLDVSTEDVDEEIPVDVDISMLESQNIEFPNAEWDEDDADAVNGLNEGDEEEYNEIEDNDPLEETIESDEGEGEEGEAGDVEDDPFSEKGPSGSMESQSLHSLFPATYKEFPFNPQQDLSDDESDGSDYWDPTKKATTPVPLDHVPSSPLPLRELKRGRVVSDSEFVEDTLLLKKRRIVTFDMQEPFDHQDVPPPDVAASHIIPTLTANFTPAQTARGVFKITSETNIYAYAAEPPSRSSLMSSLSDLTIPSRIYREPYYSDALDAPAGPREYAGLTFELKGGDELANLDEWVPSDVEEGDHPPVAHALYVGDKSSSIDGWEYASLPPSVRETKKWLSYSENRSSKELQQDFRSQLKGPTQANIYGLKATPVKLESRDRKDMTVLSLEVLAPTSSNRLADAKEDAIFGVFSSFQTSESEEPSHTVIIADPTAQYATRLRGVAVNYVQTELELINEFLDMAIDLDPDLIAGWEVQNSSWGYLAARASLFGLDVEELFSRAPPQSRRTSEQYEARHTTTFHVAGRHVFNIWRIMRSEYSLGSYSFENVAFNVLGRRVPRYSPATLSTWCRSQTPQHNLNLLQHFLNRSVTNLDLINQSEMLTKTAEFARVFGVDFYSVISRGSQFKVESFMTRIAKPESLVFISPSKKDVGKQNAAECLPLVMEPQSAFYNSPLVVLDFQSLYPSIMVSRNYCYSTCLGRVVDFQGKNKFGVVEDLPRVPGLLGKLQKDISVSPNGLIFVNSNVRKGLLPRMLQELLDTRVMVKTAMKGAKNDRALTRVLNARQLGLKYIANVTYGYTSASFSGRMPVVEIADSIVQAGRETLEKSIKLISETTKWNAEVVYGDTDSLFIYLPGRTREQAFVLGQEIADTITRQNPKPMFLKFEKVYHPCVLLAKKRYVGWKYESPEDTPVFDAKGIETVRRDGVRAAQIMTEKCLKILFRTQDLSEVKDYCCDSWTKLLEGRLPARDFVFAKEVRLGTYEKNVAPPPGAAVAARRALLDPNDEPQYGERVPYVIVRRLPGTKLVDRAMDPLEFLSSNSELHLDAVYYITRVLIPPLERIFSLIGADVRQWFNEMARPKSLEVVSPSKRDPVGVVVPSRLNIYEHFDTARCLTCGDYTLEGLCYECLDETEISQTSLLTRMREGERRLLNSHRVCSSCTGLPQGEAVPCVSIDCPWLFTRKAAEGNRELLETVEDLVQQIGTMGTTSESPQSQTELPDDTIDVENLDVE